VQRASAPYVVRYALLRVEDLAKGVHLAPVVVIEFADAPLSFDPWPVMQQVLLGGDRDMLAAAGIKSYAVGYRGLKEFLVARLEDAASVPGPSSDVTIAAAKRRLAFSDV
jgi:hypothetical protein